MTVTGFKTRKAEAFSRSELNGHLIMSWRMNGTTKVGRCVKCRKTVNIPYRGKIYGDCLVETCN